MERNGQNGKTGTRLRKNGTKHKLRFAKLAPEGGKEKTHSLDIRHNRLIIKQLVLRFNFHQETLFPVRRQIQIKQQFGKIDIPAKRL